MFADAESFGQLAAPFPISVGGLNRLPATCRQVVKAALECFEPARTIVVGQVTSPQQLGSFGVALGAAAVVAHAAQPDIAGGAAQECGRSLSVVAADAAPDPDEQGLLGRFFGPSPGAAESQVSPEPGLVVAHECGYWIVLSIGVAGRAGCLRGWFEGSRHGTGFPGTAQVYAGNSENLPAAARCGGPNYASPPMPVRA